MKRRLSVASLLALVTAAAIGLRTGAAAAALIAGQA